jgi:hypothetical protein
MEKNDAFTFYFSQLHIHIQMDFGIMVTKWQILKAPLIIQLEKSLIYLRPLLDYTTNA